MDIILGMIRGTIIIMDGTRLGTIDARMGMLDITTLSYRHGDGEHIPTFIPIVAGLVVDIMWDMVVTTVDMDMVDMVVTDMAIMMAIMRD